MKQYLLAVLLLASGQAVFSQDHHKKNEVFLELGGNGLLGSVNYSRQLTKDPGLNFRIGIGAYGSNPTYITLPLGVNYLFRIIEKHTFLDLGLGATLTNADVTMSVRREYSEGYTHPRSKLVNFIPSIGIKTNTKKDFVWRFNITPVINNYGTVPSFGLSFGKRF
jgi:hypothetical protein